MVWKIKLQKLHVPILETNRKNLHPQKKSYTVYSVYPWHWMVSWKFMFTFTLKVVVEEADTVDLEEGGGEVLTPEVDW